MENQGYEEEQSRAEKESTSHDTIERNDSVIARMHPESHVYEDISSDTAAVSKFSERISFPDDTRETEDRRSADLARQAWIDEPSSVAADAILDKSFQQNLTLDSSAEIGANHDSGISSTRAVSGTNKDVLEGAKNPRDLPRSLADGDVHENVFSSPREKDLTRDTPVQPDRRTNRRRKKKDCKHCRNKLAVVNSCDKLDELASSEDAILKENEINHRNKDPDFTSSLLFRESLLRPQNIKIYPIVKRTSLGDIGVKNFSTAFLENELHSRMNCTAENAARFLLNDKMLDKVTESNRNKILEVSRNGTDMRINSIYSQDRWYGKESIFYTDVKDQNPFQVNCLQKCLLFSAYTFFKFIDTVQYSILI